MVVESKMLRWVFGCWVREDNKNAEIGLCTLLKQLNEFEMGKVCSTYTYWRLCLHTKFSSIMWCKYPLPLGRLTPTKRGRLVLKLIVRIWGESEFEGVDSDGGGRTFMTIWASQKWLCCVELISYRSIIKITPDLPECLIFWNECASNKLSRVIRQDNFIELRRREGFKWVCFIFLPLIIHSFFWYFFFSCNLWMVCVSLCCDRSAYSKPNFLDSQQTRLNPSAVWCLTVY